MRNYCSVIIKKRHRMLLLYFCYGINEINVLFYKASVPKKLTSKTMLMYWFVPGVGEIADGVNALISLGRGDVTGAALSLRFFFRPIIRL